MEAGLSESDSAILKRHLSAHCWSDQHTITGLLRSGHRYYQDWSADYRLYSKDIDTQGLFKPIIRILSSTIAEDEPLILCVDDSLIKKTGKRIMEAGYYRDPLGPAFHVNLMYALRFVQISMAVPDEEYIRAYRTIPVAAEVIGKPPKDIDREQRYEYSPSMHAINLLNQIRAGFGQEQSSRKIILCGDAGYTTSTLLQRLPENVTYIGRFRKDAALFVPIDSREKKVGRPQAYGEQLPTPEQLRKDNDIPWQKANIKRNNKVQTIDYKRIARAKWRAAGENVTVQVVVVRPLRRGKFSSGGYSYTQPTYLLCTDTEMPAEELIQAYLARWGIEVNFKEEKQIAGIGQAQLWNTQHVRTAPIVAIAAYSATLLAGKEMFADGLVPDHLKFGRWQRRHKFKSYTTRDIRMQLYNDLKNQLNGDTNQNEILETNIIKPASTA
jgi:hypothetical protein